MFDETVRDHKRIYARWNNMNRRCSCEKALCYTNYGGQGIKVDPEWNRDNPQGFINFFEWYITKLKAIPANDLKSFFKVIRRDVKGNFGPANCFITSKSTVREPRRPYSEFRNNKNTREIQMPKISIIVAMDMYRGIGKENALPWRLKADMEHFKNTTMGNTVIMGRKTFDSIGRALPGRRNIVITRDRKWKARDVIIVHSLEDALRQVKDKDQAFIIGGGEIYAQALPLADRLITTRIGSDFECDVQFPRIERSHWVLDTIQRHVEESIGLSFEIVTQTRIRR